jgi:hypothetical protein
MQHPQVSLTATPALSESFAAAAAAQEQKPSIDVLSFTIPHKIPQMKPSMAENAIISPPSQLAMLQGKKEISKKKSLLGSRLAAVADSNPTATKTGQPSTNGSPTETKTKTKDTVRSNVAHIYNTLQLLVATKTNKRNLYH